MSAILGWRRHHSDAMRQAPHTYGKGYAQHECRHACGDEKHLDILSDQ
jgi:hypothetical protein